MINFSSSCCGADWKRHKRSEDTSNLTRTLEIRYELLPKTDQSWAIFNRLKGFLLRLRYYSLFFRFRI